MSAGLQSSAPGQERPIGSPSGEPRVAAVAALRPMSEADVEAVMAVEVAAYGFPWSRGNFVDSLRAGHLAQVLQQEDGALLGYFVALQGVDELHLLNLTVAVSAQGQGHGRRLMDRLEHLARERGNAALWLEVRLSNARARALYARRGYVEQGLRRGYYPMSASRREDAVVMSLDLLGSPRDAAQ